MFLHFFFLVLYGFFSIFSSDVVLSILLSLHAAAMLIDRHLIRKMALDPMSAYGVYCLLMGVSNIVMINDVADGTVFFAYQYIIPKHITESISIVFVGNAFIFIGYELFYNSSFSSVVINVTKRSHHALLFWIMALASLRNMFFNESILGSLTTILLIFSLVGILYFARLWARFDDKQYRNYAITLFVLQTVYALGVSYLRAHMILPTISLAIGYFLGRGSIKEVFSYKAIPFAVLALLFSSFFAFFGQHRGRLEGGLQRMEQLINLSKVEQVYEDEDENKQESIIYRTSVLPQVTNVVELVDTRGHFNGDASTPLLIALVPRFLWPEKPLIGLGAWFAMEIGQSVQTESWYSNSINMTIPGHLYLDFGWIGLALGCLIVGGILAGMWNATGFHGSPFNLTGVILGGYLMLISLQGIGADLQILITLLSYYLIFLFFRILK